MSGNVVDQNLDQILANAAPSSIEEVLNIMARLDAALPNNDGLKWFNLLYMLVTRAVLNNQPPNGWGDPSWLERLDIVFAELYFVAIRNWIRGPEFAPRSWQALFESRFRTNVTRVQFALCGMNAHINHDLPLALAQVRGELPSTPAGQSVRHADFEAVNTVLIMVEPEAMRYLATGIIGQIDESLGDIDNVIRMWSVGRARETAWNNGEILWDLRTVPPLRNKFIRTLDGLTGFAGRGLLIPIR